jgi:hypothetical protein
MTSVDPLARVATLLGAASSAADRETRVLYLAGARTALDAVNVRATELALLLDAAEREMARR